MRVARRNRVTNSEQLEGPFRVTLHALGCAINERGVIDGAEIARVRLELIIEIVKWDRSVIDDHLIDAPLADAAIVAADTCKQPIAVLLDPLKPVRDSEDHVVLLQC